MLSSPRLRRHRSDVWMIVMYLFLVGTSLLMIHSVGAPPEGYTQDWAGMIATPVGKQAIWLGISLGAWFLVNAAIDRRVWVIGAYPIYVATLVLLVLVLLIGKEINGARSWFSLAGFTFQPSELAKFGACLAMAAYLSAWTGKLNRLRVVATGMLIWLLPAVIIMGQPDAGSALVFASFLLVMYREGLSGLLYLFSFFSAAMFILGILYPPFALTGGLLALATTGLAFAVRKRTLLYGSGALLAVAAGVVAYAWGYAVYALVGVGSLFVLAALYHLLQRRQRLVGLAAAAVVWGVLLCYVANYTFENVLRPHHQERINVWLRPADMDPRGALYNVLQSKLAIAAGGLQGRGLQQGTMTKYDYVPEQLTDFIFTAVGEEQGFTGTSTVIIAFMIMLWRCSVIAERQKRPFVRAYAYGFAGILLIHLLVNVGMTVGLMPVIGIPLPFLSKGGSSLLSFTIMLAVLLKLDKHRDEV